MPKSDAGSVCDSMSEKRRSKKDEEDRVLSVGTRNASCQVSCAHSHAHSKPETKIYYVKR